MPNVAIKGTAYCLNYAHELGLHHGTTCSQENHSKPDSDLCKNIANSAQNYTNACRYAPNLTFIGALSTDELNQHPKPFIENPCNKTTRFGKYGEIMPENEFIGLLDICDTFDLVWLEIAFAAQIKTELASNKVIKETQLNRLKAGHVLADIETEINTKGALALYFEGKIVACVRKGHESDENLSAHILLENLCSKAGSVLALLHLLENSKMQPEDVDFVIECSEEAAGDCNQRGGGNIAKAVAEIAACVNASGFDVRAFCAGPVSALLAAAGMVASGIRANVAVVAGGAVPKLYMNAKEHVRKKVIPLENCLANMAIMLVPDNGSLPVMRLDAIGKHSVGAGASPQAVTSALVWEPLQKVGLNFVDVDTYAPELHITDITIPAGAGNVPESNYKMIAALAVMKGQIERNALNDFVEKHGLQGFAHTQGHIPSGVPFIGHAVDAIKAGKIKRAMIIGKGSLFLARLTNLADGASFLIEAATPIAEKVEISEQINANDIKSILLEALSDLSTKLLKG